MEPEKKPTEPYRAPYEKLTEEQKQRLGAQFRKLRDEGVLQLPEDQLRLQLDRN